MTKTRHILSIALDHPALTSVFIADAALLLFMHTSQFSFWVSLLLLTVLVVCCIAIGKALAMAELSRQRQPEDQDSNASEP